MGFGEWSRGVTTNRASATRVEYGVRLQDGRLHPILGIYGTDADHLRMARGLQDRSPGSVVIWRTVTVTTDFSVWSRVPEDIEKSEEPT